MIIEHAYMDNPHDNAILKDEAQLKAMEFGLSRCYCILLLVFANCAGKEQFKLTLKGEWFIICNIYVTS